MPARWRTSPPKLNQPGFGAHSVSSRGISTTIRRVRSCTRSRWSRNSFTGCVVILRKLEALATGVNRRHSTGYEPLGPTPDRREHCDVRDTVLLPSDHGLVGA